MKPESIVFAIAGTCFGLIVGWVLGTQQAGRRPAMAVPQTQTAASAPADSGSAPRAAVLDQSQVQALQNVISSDPKNANARVQLANLYFDAEKYEDAIRWYEEALKLNPKDANVSTDLGVSYYYLNQPDRALQQFEHSLAIDPRHAKTFYNQGIVRAFGKQDLEGAAQAWQKVIDVAPNSPEAQGAKRALDSLKSAHPGMGGAGAPK
jgi:tetratricopeptide (TPR) repeat protein